MAIQIQVPKTNVSPKSLLNIRISPFQVYYQGFKRISPKTFIPAPKFKKGVFWFLGIIPLRRN